MLFAPSLNPYHCSLIVKNPGCQNCGTRRHLQRQVCSSQRLIITCLVPRSTPILPSTYDVKPISLQIHNRTPVFPVCVPVHRRNIASTPPRLPTVNSLSGSVKEIQLPLILLRSVAMRGNIPCLSMLSILISASFH